MTRNAKDIRKFDGERKLTLVNGPRRNSPLFSVSSPFLNKGQDASMRRTFKRIFYVERVDSYRFSSYNILQSVQRRCTMIHGDDNVEKSGFHSPISVADSL